MKFTRYKDMSNEIFESDSYKRGEITNLVVKIGDKTFFNKNAATTFYDVIEFISKSVGIEKFIEDNIDSKIIGLKKEDFPIYTRSVLRNNSTGQFIINPHSSTVEKKNILDSLFKLYNIEGTVDVRSRVVFPFSTKIDVVDSEEDIDEMDEMSEEDIDDSYLGSNKKIFLSEFWSYFLSKINDYTDVYSRRTKGSKMWLTGTTGVRDVNLNCIVSSKYIKIELFIGRFEKEENKKIFDWLYNKKDEIEKSFGSELNWYKMDDKKSSYVSYKLVNINAYDKSNWDKVMDFFINYFPKFEKSLKPYISEIPKIISESDEIKKVSDFKEKIVERPVINPFGGESTKNSIKDTSAICVLGKSGAGKTYRIEKTLEKEGHISEVIIPSSSTTNLLVQYTKGDYVLSRLGNLILKANSDKSHYYTIVFDECHKYIEMINDELLQCISTKRNDGLRFISLDPVTDVLFSELPEKNGRRIISDNLGFIFISSKEEIIRDNSDFYNRVDIITIDKSDRDIDFAIEILKNKIESREDEGYSIEE